VKNAIEAVGLVKRYGEVTALGGLDLAVVEGSVMGLLGPNGAGKTTAVSILSTLLIPDEDAGIDTAVVRWTGTTAKGADDLVAPGGGRVTQSAKAEDFIVSYLSSRPGQTSQAENVKEAAANDGHKKRTTERTAENMELHATLRRDKSGYQGNTEWTLIPSNADGETGETGETDVSQDSEDQPRHSRHARQQSQQGTNESPDLDPLEPPTDLFEWAEANVREHFPDATLAEPYHGG
jgi:energy-coupling factor transporter ATP-binding protein EcfA2